MQQKTKEKAKGTLPEDYQINLSDFALFLSVMKVKEVKVERVILNQSFLLHGKIFLAGI